jgi:pyrimidine operon attenuation protein/uracil phosphoribosyltransferase
MVNFAASSMQNANQTAPTFILQGKKFAVTIQRLCHQLIENHGNFESTVLLGLQPRGIFLASAIHKNLTHILSSEKILLGKLDATFHRDDFRRHDHPLIPSAVEIDFSLEDKNVVLIDDVLYTGRTIRAGLDAMLDFGRPAKVELLVLVDRRYSRQLPIEPDYVGLTVDTRANQKVKVSWQAAEGENSVMLLKTE